MAGLEISFLSKVVQAGDIVPAVEARITGEHFTDDKMREVWDWIVSYWHEHGVTPARSVFKREYPDVTLVDQKDVPYEGLVAELRAARQRVQLNESLGQILNKANADDVRGAISVMASALSTLAYEGSALQDIDIVQTWDQRVTEYLERAQRPGHMRPGSLPTGFHGLDVITSGISRQQLITVVGEPKVGKSTIALIMAMAAHNFGVVPMFVSFEMSAQEQTDRHDAIIGGVSHSDLRNGTLSALDLQRLQRNLKRRKSYHPFIISVDRSSVTTLSALRAKVQQHQPRILFVDGVYMMDDEQGERQGSPQAITNITRGLKRMAQQLDIPIVQTTQVLTWKLNSRKTREVTGDAIGYSSSFVQDSDLVLGVERHPEQDDVSILRVVLGRNVPANRTVEISWDWGHSRFDELDGSEVSYERSERTV